MAMMQKPKKSWPLLAALGAVMLAAPAWAQNSSPNVTGPALRGEPFPRSGSALEPGNPPPGSAADIARRGRGQAEFEFSSPTRPSLGTGGPPANLPPPIHDNVPGNSPAPRVPAR